MTKHLSRSSSKITLYYLRRIGVEADKNNIAKTMRIAKSLLYDYSEEDILDTIDFILDVKKVDMYSLGYVSASISTLIKDVRKERARKVVRGMTQESSRDEVTIEHGSQERNRDKRQQLGVQSRIREKYSKHLFEGDGEDS